MGTGGRNKSAEKIYDFIELLNRSIYALASETGRDESNLPKFKNVGLGTYEVSFGRANYIVSFKEKK